MTHIKHNLSTHITILLTHYSSVIHLIQNHDSNFLHENEILTFPYYERIGMDSVNIAFDAGTRFSHYSTSASIIIVNKTRLFYGIGSFHVRDLFFRHQPQIRFYCLNHLAHQFVCFQQDWHITVSHLCMFLSVF